MNPSTLHLIRLPLLALTLAANLLHAGEYNVKAYGAVGDGKAIDTAAIEKAIADAAGHGGGTVYFPAGTYASFTIHLQSNLTLLLDAGATLLAAEPPADGTGGYDLPEPNPGVDQYQDFGHSHYRNSLIVGEGVHDITILGPGRIYGYGLSKGSGLRDQTPEERTAGLAAPSAGNRPKAAAGIRGPFGYPSAHSALANGVGNKSIALKNCRNVLIRDLTMVHGGHFALLLTGTDNLTLDNLRIDTNRDGMDIDSCHHVSVSNCFVNSPFDDGICLKADYGLGYARACEDVAITNCHVSGFDEGTFISGTCERTIMAKSKNGPTGRIKLGTEGTGGFKNISISNCTFEFCRGLALEEVDGAALEDVSVTNLTMRDINTAAIYVRLGSRNRGPAPIATGSARRIAISNVVASGVDPRYSSIIAGIPGHDIEDITLRNIRILYQGGGTAAQAAREPPERETGYPETTNLGIIPAYGFFIRHVRGIKMSDIDVGTATPDARPPFVLEAVTGAEFFHVAAPRAGSVPVFVLRNVQGLEVGHCAGAPDTVSTGPIADGKL